MRKNKIRILHVAQAAGGVDRYIRMLLKYLDKEKFENILVCSQDFHEEDYRDLVDSFEQVEMTRAIGGNDLKAIKEVRTLIKKYNPDIVYAHSSKAGAIARVADIGLKNHCVYNPHGWAFNMRCSAKKKAMYKEKPILTDIKRRIQTIVVPYFSFGLLVLLYWQVIERRFRDSDMSFTESLIGLFSGSYNNLDFNVHLWFLPCFFVTVVLFNILVNLGGRKTAYIVSALMSLIYVILSMPELLWGFNRVFKYIGFYAVGVSLAGRETKIADRKIGTGVTAVVLLTVNFILSLYNLTTGIMWFVTALIGVAAVILISQFINENRILQYFGRISLIVLCIHGPVYRVVVKIISIPLHMGTDAVREKFLLAMLVMIVTMVICSLAYEIIVRVAPWMIGKKKVKVL